LSASHVSRLKSAKIRFLRRSRRATVTSEPDAVSTDDYSTLEVARLLGMAVRSVQMMVDRGELEAWKTPGGHRRISRPSVERWRASRQQPRSADTLPAAPDEPPLAAVAGAASAPVVLLIEDSVHYQNLISLLVRQRFPGVNLQIADDGIAGLAMAGRLQPRVMIVDILLPGIDGATLDHEPAFAPAVHGHPADRRHLAGRCRTRALRLRLDRSAGRAQDPSGGRTAGAAGCRVAHAGALGNGLSLP
jgi:excisionase family DNA binding protein